MTPDFPVLLRLSDMRTRSKQRALMRARRALNALQARRAAIESDIQEIAHRRRMGLDAPSRPATIQGAAALRSLETCLAGKNAELLEGIEAQERVVREAQAQWRKAQLRQEGLSEAKTRSDVRVRAVGAERADEAALEGRLAAGQES